MIIAKRVRHKIHESRMNTNRITTAERSQLSHGLPCELEGEIMISRVQTAGVNPYVKEKRFEFPADQFPSSSDAPDSQLESVESPGSRLVFLLFLDFFDFFDDFLDLFFDFLFLMDLSVAFRIFFPISSDEDPDEWWEEEEEDRSSDSLLLRDLERRLR